MAVVKRIVAVATPSVFSVLLVWIAESWDDRWMVFLGPAVAGVGVGFAAVAAALAIHGTPRLPRRMAALGTLYACAGITIGAFFGITEVLAGVYAGLDAPPSHQVMGIVLVALLVASAVYWTGVVSLAWGLDTGDLRPGRSAAFVVVVLGVLVAWLSAREQPGGSFEADAARSRGNGSMDVLIVADPHDSAGRRLIAEARTRALWSGRPPNHAPMDVAVGLAVLGHPGNGFLPTYYDTKVDPTAGSDGLAKVVAALARLRPEAGPRAYRSYGRLLLDAQWPFGRLIGGSGSARGVEWRKGTRRAVVFVTSRVPTEREEGPTRNPHSEAVGILDDEPVTLRAAVGQLNDFPQDFETAFGNPLEALTLFALTPDRTGSRAAAFRRVAATAGGGGLLDPAAYRGEPLVRAAVAGATGVPPRAARALAERHRPDLHFATGEKSQPVDVDAVLARPARRQSHRVCAESENGDDCADVNGWKSLLGKRYGYIDFHGDVRTGPLASDERKARYRRQARMYYRIMRKARAMYVAYWWYFRVNPSPVQARRTCLPGLSVRDITCYDHEGDWEGVTVALRPADADRVPPADIDAPAAYRGWKPNWVAYEAHGRAIAWSWPTLAAAESVRDATHPIVYVARDSHASYPLRCTDCRQILANSGLPEGPFDGREAWRYNKPDCDGSPCLWPLPVLPTRPRVVDPDATWTGDALTWNAFPGRWGKAECLFIAKVCTQAAGPRSPSNQARGREPWKVRPPNRAARRRFQRIAGSS